MWTSARPLTNESSNNLVEIFRLHYPYMDTNTTLQRKIEAATEELASRDIEANQSFLPYLERFLAKAKGEGNEASAAIHFQMITYYKKTVLTNH